MCFSDPYPNARSRFRSSRSAVWVAAFCALLTAVAGQSHSPAHSNPPKFVLLSSEADAARDANRLDEAASLYRRALALRPSWAEGWWSLGTLEYDQDHYSKAAAALKKVVTFQPENGTAYAMLGLSEFELGRPQLALQHIEKGKNLGLQKNPDLWHVVLYHEGLLLQRKGSFQAAQDTLEELCLEVGPNEKAANVLGMTMLRLRANDPPTPGTPDGNVVAQVGRAECLAGQKKYDEARPIFESLVQENPAYPNLHYAFGLFLIELRDVPGAVAQFKQEIANNPQDVIARLRIGAVEFKEDSASAIPYVEDAVKLDPQSPFAHYLLGMLRLDVDDYLKAIPELEIAKKGMPREPKIYFALGTAYSRAGRRQDAARARTTFQRLTEEAAKSSVPSVTADESRIRIDDPR
jgi:tetratricopeptide (TPR) repeat protein